jgi:hypothetical protein
MKFIPGEVTASIEEIAVYNIVLCQAMFEVLMSSGVLDGQAIRETIAQIKADLKKAHCVALGHLCDDVMPKLMDRLSE